MRMLLFSLLLTAALVMGAAAAPGDYEVMASNVEALKTGQRLPIGAAIKLPAGGEVTLIDRTGATAAQKICIGAYDGPIQSCPGKSTCTMWQRLTAGCPAGFDKGGTRGPVTGGTRGIKLMPKP